MFEWLTRSRKLQLVENTSPANNSTPIILFCYDVDETLSWLHLGCMSPDDLRLSHIKGAERLKAQFERIFNEGHCAALTSNNEEIDLLKKIFEIIGLDAEITARIPIIGKSMDGGKRHHVNFALKELPDNLRKIVKVVLTDDSPANIFSVYEVGHAGIVVATPDPEHAVRLDPLSHLDAIDAILDDPASYRFICDEHNQRVSNQSFEPKPLVRAGKVEAISIRTSQIQ